MDSRKNLGVDFSQRETKQTEAANPATLTGGAVMEFSWLQIAKKEMGTEEVPGAANNARIVEYHATTTLKATADSVPWCSSFVNWCIEKAGYKGTDSAAALSWHSWGEHAHEFIPTGSIVVMKRKGGGHVGFKVGQDQFYVYVLGGNQSDAVNIRPFAHSQVVSYRLPAILNDNDDVVFDYLSRHEVQ